MYAILQYQLLSGSKLSGEPVTTDFQKVSFLLSSMLLEEIEQPSDLPGACAG